MVDREKIHDYPSVTRLNPEAQKLIGQYLESDTYTLTLQKINAALLLAQGNRSLLDYIRKYSIGRLFEELSYRHLSNQLEQDQILLSPLDVDTIYKRLHPDRRVINNFSLLEGIEGISLPDGFLLKKGESSWLIVNVCEYTAAQEPTDNKVHQLPAFANRRTTLNNLKLADTVNVKKGGWGNLLVGRLISELRPCLQFMPVCLAPEVSLKYAVTERSKLHWPGEEVHLPFTSSEFNKLIIDILDQARRPSLLCA